ncbi:MAG: DUF192 domain-containing protein [Thaumarchaeota archaeon]|nr:DUF192 domain-containing protein [Nitrososphaerota archaeon]
MALPGTRFVVGVLSAVLIVSAVAYLYAGTAGDANLKYIPTEFTVNGTALHFTSVATTEGERETGLMNAKITDSTFMLFAFTYPRTYSFWMHDTNSSLDIIWINGTESGGIVVYVVTDAPSCYSSACPTYASNAPANFAIEGKAGFVVKYGVALGSYVRFG